MGELGRWYVTPLDVTRRLCANVLLTEKANEATNAERETQDRIGKIEVVVLRCDDDGLPALERQMRAAEIAAAASAKAPEKAPSAKAPSIKAPSSKAPSAKVPSAVSAGLGGLFGIFEGACDVRADRAGDGNMVQQCHIPVGLDGQEYEHLHTVVDQYGRPYVARTPYHHSFGAERPQNIEHRRNVNANFDYVSTRGVPTRALGGGQRPETGYTAAPVLVSVPPYAPQQTQQPRGNYAPAGQPYLQIYDSPQPRRTTHRPPANDYIDPASGVRYIVQDGVPKSYIDPRPHSHPLQVIEETPRVPAIIDPEFQRFQIFKMAETIERLLDVNHRFVAAAVPYMSQLKTTPIADLGFEEMRDLRRDLHRCLDRGCYPNGDSIKEEFNDPRDRRSRSRRRRSASRRAESSHRHADQPKAGEDGGKVMSWIKESNKAESKRSDSRDRKSQRSHGRSQTKSQNSNAGWSNNGGANAQAGEWDNQNDTSGQQDDQNNDNNNWETGAQTNAVNAWGQEPEQKAKPSSTKSSSTLNFSFANFGAGLNKSSQPVHPSHHSKSTDPHAYVQPYFETWRGNGQNFATKPLARQPREACPYPPASAPHILSDQVGDRSHGVRAGKGADYTHRVRRPKYLDTMEDPYAVFVFNYRSAEKLEEILHQSVQADLALVAEEVGRGVLMNLPREKLVEELMKTQAKATGRGGVAKAPSKSGDAVESKAKSAAPSVRSQKVTNNWATAPAQDNTGQGPGFTPDGGGDAKEANGWGGGFQQVGQGTTGPAGVKW